MSKNNNVKQYSIDRLKGMNFLRLSPGDMAVVESLIKENPQVVDINLNTESDPCSLAKYAVRFMNVTLMQQIMKYTNKLPSSITILDIIKHTYASGSSFGYDIYSRHAEYFINLFAQYDHECLQDALNEAIIYGNIFAVSILRNTLHHINQLQNMQNDNNNNIPFDTSYKFSQHTTIQQSSLKINDTNNNNNNNDNFNSLGLLSQASSIFDVNIFTSPPMQKISNQVIKAYQTHLHTEKMIMPKQNVPQTPASIARTIGIHMKQAIKDGDLNAVQDIINQHSNAFKIKLVSNDNVWMPVYCACMGLQPEIAKRLIALYTDKNELLADLPKVHYIFKVVSHFEALLTPESYHPRLEKTCKMLMSIRPYYEIANDSKLLLNNLKYMIQSNYLKAIKIYIKCGLPLPKHEDFQEIDNTSTEFLKAFLYKQGSDFVIHDCVELYKERNENIAKYSSSDLPLWLNIRSNPPSYGSVTFVQNIKNNNKRDSSELATDISRKKVKNTNDNDLAFRLARMEAEVDLYKSDMKNTIKHLKTDMLLLQDKYQKSQEENIQLKMHIVDLNQKSIDNAIRMQEQINSLYSQLQTETQNGNLVQQSIDIIINQNVNLGDSADLHIGQQVDDNSVIDLTKNDIIWDGKV